MFTGLDWVDPDLKRKPPRPLIETPAYPDLAGTSECNLRIDVVFVVSPAMLSCCWLLGDRTASDA